MNREQAKKLLPIIQAFADGKSIQIRNHGEEKYYDSTNNNLNFNLDYYDYRIKIEPKYRPFANAEECWQEMLKHQPFGWIKSISKNFYSIMEITDNACIFIDDHRLTFCDMYKYNTTFADGTPFGIKDE